MIDLRVILTVVFFVALAWYVYAKRKEMQTQSVLPPLLYFSMYRTTWGLASMDVWAKKYGRVLNWLGIAGIWAGFLGMVFISVALVKNLFDLFSKPDAVAGAGLVLPIKAKGVFHVPIEYWVICLFVIVIVHEFAHGVLSRLYGVKVKSSGFAFAGTTLRTLGAILILIGLWGNFKDVGAVFDLTTSPDIYLAVGALMIASSLLSNIMAPIIPAAFVEPDEKQLRKKPLKQQLAVFAAGPFANVILAFMVAGLALGMVGVFYNPIGVEVTNYVNETSALRDAGVPLGERIVGLEGVPTLTDKELKKQIKHRSPGDTVRLQTNVSSYSVTLISRPDNDEKPYFGAYLEPLAVRDPEAENLIGKVGFAILNWFLGLLLYMYILNLGIGLFNLLPIGPLDGGRMVHLVLTTYMEKSRAMKIFVAVGLFFIVIVALNILFPFFKPLFLGN